MELSGTLPENLRAAITSARRLSGSAVHDDTLAFWQDLLAFAQARLERGTSDAGEVSRLADELAEELSLRAAAAESQPR